MHRLSQHSVGRKRPRSLDPERVPWGFAHRDQNITVDETNILSSEEETPILNRGRKTPEAVGLITDELLMVQSGNDKAELEKVSGGGGTDLLNGASFAHILDDLTSSDTSSVQRYDLLGEGSDSPPTMRDEMLGSRPQSPVSKDEAAGDILRREDTTRSLVSPVMCSPTGMNVESAATDTAEDKEPGTLAASVAVRPLPPIIAPQAVRASASSTHGHVWHEVIKSDNAAARSQSQLPSPPDAGQPRSRVLELLEAATSTLLEHNPSSPQPAAAQLPVRTASIDALCTPTDSSAPLPPPANLSSTSSAWGAAAFRSSADAGSATPAFASWASSIGGAGNSAPVSWPAGSMASSVCGEAPSALSSWSSIPGARAGPGFDSFKSWGSAWGTAPVATSRDAQQASQTLSSWPASSKWAGELARVDEDGSGDSVEEEVKVKTEEEEGKKIDEEGVSVPATVVEGEGAGVEGGKLVMPQCGGFEVKAIATGICQLFPQVKRTEQELDCLIDIDVLAAHCQTGAGVSRAGVGDQPAAEVERVEEERRKKGGSQPRCAIVEVCGRACPKGGSNSGGRQELSSKRAKGRTNRLNNVCAFKMCLAGGGDKVTLRLWANGKTQTSGCKNVDMLRAANEFISDAVIQIHKLAKADPRLNIPPIFVPGDAFAEAVMQSTEHVRILSAPILGSWDLNLRATHFKLNMTNLCSFLSQPSYADRVLAVKHVQPKGNSARFNNLSLYVRREALTSWKEHDNPDLASLYVNVYEAGKCSVLAAPDHGVAEELSRVVSEMLLEAYRHAHIRQYCPDFDKKRVYPTSEERESERASKLQKSKPGSVAVAGGGEGSASVSTVASIQSVETLASLSSTGAAGRKKKSAPAKEAEEGASSAADASGEEPKGSSAEGGAPTAKQVAAAERKAKAKQVAQSKREQEQAAAALSSLPPTLGAPEPAAGAPPALDASKLLGLAGLAGLAGEGFAGASLQQLTPQQWAALTGGHLTALPGGFALMAAGSGVVGGGGGGAGQFDVAQLPMSLGALPQYLPASGLLDASALGALAGSLGPQAMLGGPGARAAPTPHLFLLGYEAGLAGPPAGSFGFGRPMPDMGLMNAPRGGCGGGGMSQPLQPQAVRPAVGLGGGLGLLLGLGNNGGGPGQGPVSSQGQGPGRPAGGQ